MTPDNTLNQTIEQIKSVKVQGATEVARQSLLALARWALSARQRPRFLVELAEIARRLSRARPTEPLARNLVTFYLKEITTLQTKGQLKASALAASRDQLLALVSKARVQVAKTGANLVASGDTIFTHCHSRLAEGILITAHNQGKQFTVYHTETRPLYQGHLTAKHLAAAGIKVTMVVDSAAAFLVSRWSGDDVEVSKVVLGADSLAPDGSTLNKVGSFGIALAAYTSRIPVYIATSLLKFDATATSPIEMRDGRELWPQAPRHLRVVNYAFDRIPAEFITAYITEAGLVKPKQLAGAAQRVYRQIFTSS